MSALSLAVPNNSGPTGTVMCGFCCAGGGFAGGVLQQRRRGGSHQHSAGDSCPVCSIRPSICRESRLNAIQGLINQVAQTDMAGHLLSAACPCSTCSVAPPGWVQELEEPDFHHFFVKKTCTLAMDKHGRCDLCLQCIRKHLNLVLLPLILAP